MSGLLFNGYLRSVPPANKRGGSVRDDEYGQCDVSDWRDIVAVESGNIHKATNMGNSHTIGLRSDGTCY